MIERRQDMAARPTIRDVAREAGVSTATVDRVLNAREAVREETARRVYAAAAQIGYHAAPLIAQRLAPNVEEMSFGFVFQKEKQAFYQALVSEIEKAVRGCERVRGRAIFEFVSSQSPSEFAKALRGMRARADVVGSSAVAHPEVSDAVSDLKAAGVPTFALLNDFAQGIRQNYVGLNNVKVGRLAASMVALAAKRSGKVAVFVGGHRWHGHELRETGFRSYFREYAPQFAILDTLINLETRQLTYEATLDLLQRHPDLRGIYCAGGGMEGAIAALREVRDPGEVALVVNEITAESRSALADRYVSMVIATPLARFCPEVVNLMVDCMQSGMSELVGQVFHQPDLFLQESV